MSVSLVAAGVILVGWTMIAFKYLMLKRKVDLA